ncbi:LOW QUALITY PROTEIN: protein lin-37 homolog [Columba livia]|uniref:LOW QUALITY PROTEIN: protein lin-37 homolog n=1 Tax=Columba livia TaxID=8932 RepID=UPI0031BB80C5
MLSVKVKVEKPDLEATSARSRLDAVLQGLLERSHGPREASPTAPGKRPSGRFPQQRRKKRREADEGPDPAQQRPSTYVIRLFERSVELGQFPDETPLYPVCRAWMRNCPVGRGQGAEPRPAPAHHRGPGACWEGGGCIRAAPPRPPPAPPASPPPLGPDPDAPPPDQVHDPAPSMSSLIYKNMERWKRVRQRWREAGQRQQQRYANSLRLLRIIYERQ